MNIFLVTHSPSPYQVELFNEIAAQDEVQLSVAYLFSGDPARNWSEVEVRHEAMRLDGAQSKLTETMRRMACADLAVFNYYNDPFAARLMKNRAATLKPWVFWGERPGSRGDSWAGRWLRRWKLRRLRRSQASIWGIGRFAIERYRNEFGANRTYCNLPYFSDLERFERLARRPVDGNERTILFSGALIPRKGVDLLARVFTVVAQSCRNLKLHVLGDGELRGTLERSLGSLGERVKFLGFKDWQELPDVYGSADVLCVPSRYDGWGLVVPEGLAAGLPVIGTDRMGAALEFLETGRNGWLIRAGDESALESVLREVATLPAEKLAAMSVAARDTVKSHSLKQGAQRFLAAAREAVANWRK